MEELAVKALVVKSVDYGDFDKLLTLVSEDSGKLTVSVKGGKSLRSKFVSICEPFTFASLNLRRRGKYFYVYDSDLIEDFYPLRDSIEKISLASYICDVAADVSLEGISDPGILKLALNTLWALSYMDKPLNLIKGAYEFKISSICGFMPELSVCDICKKTGDGMFVDVRGGRLICDSCLKLGHMKNGLESTSVILPVSDEVLSVLRYIAVCPIQRFLSFNLSENKFGEFETLCEKYLINHLEREFYTLTFYKSLLL